jgi:hypothetical protein
MFSKNLIYFSANIDASPKADEQSKKGPEAPKNPEQQLDADKQKFQSKVDQVKKTVEQYSKDQNPDVQKAARDAMAKIQILEKNPLLDQKSIDAELQQIYKITEFVDGTRNMEASKSKLLAEREKGVQSKAELLAKANADLLARHPDLLRNSNATILLKRLELKYAESFKAAMAAPVSKDLAVAPSMVKVSFSDHLQDGNKLAQANSELGSALTFDREFDHDLDGKLADFNTEADSLATEYLSKMGEESTKYVATESRIARERLEASGVYNKQQLLADLQQLEDGTIGNLNLVKHAGEEDKRAMIMAKFKDNLNQLVGKALVDNISDNPNSVRDLLAKRLKITPDETAKLFEQQGVSLNEQEGLGTDSKFQITANNVQIRGIDGSQMSYLNKNQKVQILDGGVYVVNDAFKQGIGGPEAYRYYKVRLEPQGAIGMVEAKYINFTPKMRQGVTVVEGKENKAAS